MRLWKAALPVVAGSVPLMQPVLPAEPMTIADDIRQLREQLDSGLRENRDDVQAVSRQVAKLEKDHEILNAAHRASIEAGYNDRRAMREDIAKLGKDQEAMNTLMREHIASVNAITNQWKGATQAGNMIARALFRVVGWLGAAGLAVWAAWDQIKHAWQVIFR